MEERPLRSLEPHRRHLFHKHKSQADRSAYLVRPELYMAVTKGLQEEKLTYFETRAN